ncbi:MAG TPA: D-aminoacylase, partial [Anaerolineae bacterium]|nr:D-aminoacylase [Anaerolineae bacterium]
MTRCDTLIRQARIVDGTGNPWFYGDVALSGDKIAEITPPGRLPLEQAGEVVEAAGLVVCPGFIDILSHSILPLMVDGRSLSKITQGVTTEIMGEAWTPAPYSDVEGELLHEPLLKLIPDWYQQMKGWTRLRHWLEAMIEAGVSPNIGTFLGGGTLRELGKGMALGPADEQEQATMRRIMAEAMEDGAFGVSHALIYPPSAYVDTAEIVDTCRVVAEYGGLYITHIRSEADGLIAGLEEAIEIGRQAQVPVEIYHLKAAGKRNWRKLARVIKLIEQARAQGLDIPADMYPYPAAGTGLASVLP